MEFIALLYGDVKKCNLAELPFRFKQNSRCCSHRNELLLLCTYEGERLRDFSFHSSSFSYNFLHSVFLYIMQCAHLVVDTGERRREISHGINLFMLLTQTIFIASNESLYGSERLIFLFTIGYFFVLSTRGSISTRRF